MAVYGCIQPYNGPDIVETEYTNLHCVYPTCVHMCLSLSSPLTHLYPCLICLTANSSSFTPVAIWLIPFLYWNKFCPSLCPNHCSQDLWITQDCQPDYGYLLANLICMRLLKKHCSTYPASLMAPHKFDQGLDLVKLTSTASTPPKNGPGSLLVS